MLMLRLGLGLLMVMVLQVLWLICRDEPRLLMLAGHVCMQLLVKGLSAESDGLHAGHAGLAPVLRLVHLLRRGQSQHVCLGGLRMGRGRAIRGCLGGLCMQRGRDRLWRQAVLLLYGGLLLLLLHGLLLLVL